MHPRKPMLGAEAEGLPDPVFGCNEVGKTLADERGAGERGGVKVGEVAEDEVEDFGRYVRDWRW